MTKNKKRFLILDGNSLLHRAWHAVPPLTTADGRVVNAAYGFTNVIEKMRNELEADYLAVAWDLPGGTFRHEAYEDYKGTREKKEDELYEQIDIIKEILEAYKIPSLSKPGFEADDVVGTLAKMYGPQVETEVVILTGDLDALQLVDTDVRVLTFIKGLSQTKVYDEAAVMERYGLRPDQLVDYKALMGDSSDNIPGIAGIGKKSAAELLQSFKTMDGIFAALAKGEVPSKYAKKLEGKEEKVKAMLHLVEIVLDVDLEGFKAEDAAMEEPDVEKLKELFTDLEFTNLLRRYGAPEKEASKKNATKKIAVKEGSIKDLNTKQVVVVCEEGPQDLFGGSVKSITLYDGERASSLESPNAKEVKKVVQLLAGAEEVLGHDLKRTLHILQVEERIEATLFDVALGSYMLDSSLRAFNLPRLAEVYLSETVKETASPLAQAEVVYKVAKEIKKDLKKLPELEELTLNVEMPLIKTLYVMERSGIEVDSAYLKTLSDSFEKKLHSLTKKVCKLAGREFNLNSPSQLAEILFEDLELPTKRIKRTKTGYSTAASELEKLWDQHEIIPLMSEHREFAKLKSTYVDALPELVAPDGRIHTTYNQTVAATGRLSSKDPNLQNIPIRTELGREIRKAFVAPKGKMLVAIDYSQFELRIAAVLAHDEAFLSAFQQGADIHKRTASQVMEKPEEEITKEERYAAKAINFGILYGMGSRNLAKSTGMKQEEAKGFLEKYFVLHPGIAEYIERTKAEAHENEFVETLFGRRRWLTEINSGVGMLRASAERMAVNMPVQGTQADLMKIAMLWVESWIQETDLDAKMLLQVHDELVFEIAKKDLDAAAREIKKIMEGVWESEVPLVVDVEFGDNWGELTDWNK